LEKLTKQQSSLPETVHSSFFDLGWQAFKGACQRLAETDTTKQRAPYWREGASGLGSDDVELINNPDVKMAQFLRASPQIVDTGTVWLKFIRDLFNGDPREERQYFRVLINCAFEIFPEFFDKIEVDFDSAQIANVNLLGRNEVTWQETFSLKIDTNLFQTAFIQCRGMISPRPLVPPSCRSRR
jgi:hypothetical protein